MNNLNENIFLTEETYDEILKKLDSIPWLKEYAEQIPVDLIMKIMHFFFVIS